MLVKRIAIVLASLVLSPVCQAARWVEVANGTIAVPADALAHIQATLKERIGSAIRAKGEKPLSWQGYLVQYRGTTVQGEPAVEIHGSCGFNDDKFNARAEFGRRHTWTPRFAKRFLSVLIHSERLQPYIRPLCAA